MKIKVKTFATFRSCIGQEFLVDIPEGTRVIGLLELLTDGKPDFYNMLFESSGVLKDYVNILINGRNISFIEGLESGIREGDVVAMFPPVGGG